MADEKPGPLADGLEIERPGNVPRPAHLHGVKEGGVDNAVEVGFAAGGKAGVKFRHFLVDGQNTDPRGKMKIEGPKKNGGGMRGRKLNGGDLAEGVNAAVGPAGSGNMERLAENFFQGGFEGELDGGMGILPLPSVEILTAVSEREFKGLKLHENGGWGKKRDGRS